jgi:hypothetical protein
MCSQLDMSENEQRLVTTLTRPSDVGPSDTDASGTGPRLDELTSQLACTNQLKLYIQHHLPLAKALKLPNPEGDGAPPNPRTNLPRTNTSTLLIRTRHPKKSALMLCATMYRKKGNSAKCHMRHLPETISQIIPHILQRQRPELPNRVDWKRPRQLSKTFPAGKLRYGNPFPLVKYRGHSQGWTI